MPPPDKADRRDQRRRKAINSKFQNIRYRTLRAGEGLAAFEAERKTKVSGKTVRKVNRKR